MIDQNLIVYLVSGSDFERVIQVGLDGGGEGYTDGSVWSSVIQIESPSGDRAALI